MSKKKPIPSFSDGVTLDMSLSNSTLYSGVEFVKKGVIPDNQETQRQILTNLATLLARWKQAGAGKLYITGYLPYRIFGYILMFIGTLWKHSVVYVGPKGEQYKYEIGEWANIAGTPM